MSHPNVRRIWGALLIIFCLLASVGVRAESHDAVQKVDDSGQMEAVVLTTKRALAGAAVATRDEIMRKNRWAPLEPAASGSDPGARLDGGSLSLWMSAYRHLDWPMLTVFGNFHWSSCQFSDRHGSYDVLGLDWADPSLMLIDLGTANEARLWYRGEFPFQRSTVFNAKDPLKKAGFFAFCDGGTLDGSAFAVFYAGDSESGSILQFNGKYDHTYLVQTRNETWSAGLTWDTTLKGNASYTVQIVDEERKWSKGAFLAVRWP
ncbi:MAG TPA: hypothetical protein VNT75_00655 [Symbiobacteriaceae bacterium]|nr:hypothetical protein [Symbiobacteriaceae bacterium]